jgi:acyl-CoA synthetase (AMP-forming)/AMP-acid ligase II
LVGWVVAILLIRITRFGAASIEGYAALEEEARMPDKSDHGRLLAGTAPAPPLELVELWRALGYWNEERIGWLLEKAARMWPDRTAVVDDGGRYSFAELSRRSDAIASALLEAGIKPGHVVSWMLPNSAEAIAVATAVWRVGAVSNPIVTIYRAHELRFILGQLRPFAVIAASQFRNRRHAEELDAVLDEIGHHPALCLLSGGSLEGWRKLDDLGGGAPIPPSLEPSRPDVPCLVLYTSGSTAEPKGVLHSSRTLLHEVRSMQREWGLSWGDRFFMASPLTHITGTLQGMILPLMLGATNVLQSIWDPEAAVERIQREGVTYTVGATVFLQGTVEEYQHRGMTPTLRQFTCGGASVPPHLIELAEAIGFAAYRVWGMTEFPTTTLNSEYHSLRSRAFTDGHVAEGIDIRTVGDDGVPLPPGREGELQARGPERMLGYVAPELNKGTHFEDGWLSTGDVGFVDESGYVTVTGRIKDIINRGGEKLAARDIEDLLASHPSVAEVAVIGVPGGRLGERVCAAIVLRSGPRPPEAELKTFLESRSLARQKIPEEIRFFDELPRTAAGKVQKFKLVERWTTEPQG